MKKSVLYFCLLCYVYTYSQETKENYLELSADSISYKKDTDYVKKRTFQNNLKKKYSGKEFVYTEVEKKEEPKKKITPPDLSFFKAFIAFMQTVFPFILGGFVIFIILKLYLGGDTSFWNFKGGNKKPSEKLVYEEEDIHDVDLESLLEKAIEAKNTRLAVRYYYLLLLKKLSEKELIKYDKDKTNSEYLFEIKNLKTRNEFSYLSYIYTYVWYGEFSLNEMDFIKVAAKYQSFFKTII